MPSSGNILKYLEKKPAQVVGKKEEEEHGGRTVIREEDEDRKKEERIREKKLDEEENDRYEDSMVENNLRKKTFRNLETRTFKEKMMSFKMMSEGGECIVRSGFCTSHNNRMVREVMMKRMGEVDSEGVTSWKMREVTILACPYKKSLETHRD